MIILTSLFFLLLLWCFSSVFKGLWKNWDGCLNERVRMILHGAIIFSSPACFLLMMLYRQSMDIAKCCITMIGAVGIGFAIFRFVKYLRAVRVETKKGKEENSEVALA